MSEHENGDKIELTEQEQSRFAELLALNAHLDQTHYVSLRQLVRLETKIEGMEKNREWGNFLEIHRRAMGSLRLLPTSAVKVEQDFAAALQQEAKKDV